MNQFLSDNIICNDWMYNQYKSKKQNDLVMINQFTKSIPENMRDIICENSLRNNQLKNDTHCILGVMTRGNNDSHINELNKCTDWNNYKPLKNKNQQNFFLIPDENSTHENYLMNDQWKTCSKSHQMFDNNTKRK